MHGARNAAYASRCLSLIDPPGYLVCFAGTQLDSVPQRDELLVEDGLLGHVECEMLVCVLPGLPS